MIRDVMCLVRWVERMTQRMTGVAADRVSDGRTGTAHKKLRSITLHERKNGSEA